MFFVLDTHVNANMEGKEDSMTPLKNDDELQSIDEKDIEKEDDGLSMFMACLNLFGTGLGTGIVTLPYAFKLIGGVVSALSFCLVTVISALSAVLLSLAYTTVFVGSNHMRAPYRDMMEIAYGKYGRYLFVVLFSASMFISSIGLLSLVTHTILSIIAQGEKLKNVPFWGICLIVTIFSSCASLYRSPKRFKGISTMASLAAVFLACMVMADTIYFQHNVKQTRLLPVATHTSRAADFFSALGIILFAFSSTFVLPTVQADMKEPASMPYSAVMANIGISIGYAIPVVTAYCVLSGPSIQPSLLETFTASQLYRESIVFKVIVILSQLSLTIHILGVIVIVLNPLCLQVEEIFNVADTLNWRRVVVRFTLNFLVFLAAIVFPSFIDVLSICGGVFAIQLCITFPALIFARVHEKLHGFFKFILYVAAVVAVLISIVIFTVGLMKMKENT